MYYFKNFLEELADNTKIDFNLLNEGKALIFCGLKSNSIEKSSIEVSLGNNRGLIEVEKSMESCLPIIKCYIEDKYKDIFYLREQFFGDVLQGNKVPLDKFRKSLPMVETGCTLFIVSIEGSKYETLNTLKNAYEGSNIISMIYGEEIIIIGVFDNRECEGKKIVTLLSNKLNCRCYVSYGEVAYSVEDIKIAYEEGKEAMDLGKRIGGKGNVYNYSDMFLERAICNISNKVKTQFYNEFKDKFNNFDDEMLNTIEEFINCDLNISEAAKSLYIHRNTLIYRLDKIPKDTGYDIRNFRQAATFTIAFLIWKELK